MAWGLLLGTYALLPVFSRYRAYIAPASALLFVVPGILPVGKAPCAVNWNAIMMAAGTMGAVSLFIESTMAPIAISISRKLKISPVNAIAISSNLQGAATLAYVLLRLIGRPKGERTAIRRICRCA
ncbi:hypothetical protein ACH6CV_13980 [Bacillota bacterium Meth-B3]